MPGNFASMRGCYLEVTFTKRMTGENLGTNRGFLLNTTDTSWKLEVGNHCQAINAWRAWHDVVVVIRGGNIVDIGEIFDICLDA
jgi:hypothetical protein